MTERARLPNRRYCETFKLRFGGANRAYHVTTGYYPPDEDDNARLGEVFVNGGKSGEMIDALSSDGAILISIGLQHGASLDAMRDAVRRNQDGTPSTIVGAVLDELVKPVQHELAPKKKTVHEIVREELRNVLRAEHESTSIQTPKAPTPPVDPSTEARP